MLEDTSARINMIWFFNSFARPCASQYSAVKLEFWIDSGVHWVCSSSLEGMMAKNYPLKKTILQTESDFR